jgi:hypothetical protein
MYNISSGQWTWLSGNNTVDVRSVYGSRRIPSPTNYPGSREAHSMVFDDTINCIYVFGGNGYAQTTPAGESTLLFVSVIECRLFK